MHVKTTINAGTTIPFIEQADFFRLLSSALPVTVEFYKNGAKIGEAIDINGGYAERIPEGFDRITIYSASTQTVQFVTRNGGDVRYDNLTGNVAITNVNGAFTNAAATVTNSSAQIKAANAARRYLLIQNNDATGIVYVRLDGNTATASTGIKIAPGGSYEVSAYVPSGAITAIGSIASNANVVVVEG